MYSIYLYYVKHYNFPEMLNWGGHWQEHLQSFAKVAPLIFKIITLQAVTSKPSILKCRLDMMGQNVQTVPQIKCVFAKTRHV